MHRHIGRFNGTPEACARQAVTIVRSSNRRHLSFQPPVRRSNIWFHTHGCDTDDDCIYCACGFTCSTSSALNRHIQWFANTADAGQHIRQDLPLHPSSPKTVGTKLSPTRHAEPPTQTSPLLSSPRAHNTTTWTPSVSAPNGSQGPLVRLLIVRHAHSANKALKQGQKASKNPGLSETGCTQAIALGNRLANEFKQPEKRKSLLVVSSPMRRCLLTMLPTVRQLVLNPEQCLCHGGSFEYGCAGTAYAGTTTAEIMDEFPEFKPICFNDKGTWDYRGDNVKENEIECRPRAARIVKWCWHDARELLRPHYLGNVTPTVIFCMHQTIADLVCKLFVDGTSCQWEYGDIRYRLPNADMMQIFLHPHGKATVG